MRPNAKVVVSVDGQVVSIEDGAVDLADPTPNCNQHCCVFDTFFSIHFYVTASGNEQIDLARIRL